MPRGAALKRIVANDMMDREAFYRYMLAYSSVVPDGRIASHWQDLAGRLDEAIPHEVSFLDVVVPRRLTADVISQVTEAIESKCPTNIPSTTTYTAWSA